MSIRKSKPRPWSRSADYKHNKIQRKADSCTDHCVFCDPRFDSVVNTDSISWTGLVEACMCALYLTDTTNNEFLNIDTICNFIAAHFEGSFFDKNWRKRVSDALCHGRCFVSGKDAMSSSGWWKLNSSKLLNDLQSAFDPDGSHMPLESSQGAASPGSSDTESDLRRARQEIDDQVFKRPHPKRKRQARESPQYHYPDSEEEPQEAGDGETYTSSFEEEFEDYSCSSQVIEYEEFTCDGCHQTHTTYLLFSCEECGNLCSTCFYLAVAGPHVSHQSRGTISPPLTKEPKRARLYYSSC